MEIFPPLTTFCNAISNDPRICPAHISIYIALLQEWNINGGKSPFSIERNKIMKTAKINARYTYNKCMNGLQEFGYIIYTPASNTFTYSKVSLMKL